MKKANKRSKGSRTGQAAPSVSDHDLVDLLEDVTHALDQATAQIAGEAAHPPLAARSAPWIGEPCGPSLGSGRALSDPMLLDRYQGLLARSGLVAGSVNHLPSRSRERLEAVLGELVVSVARGRPATGAQVDALVADLIAHIGDHIAGTVQDWRDAPD